MSDYRHRLEMQLSAAADAQLGGAAKRPRRNRRVVAAVVAAALGAPAAIAATQIVDGDADRATFADGSHVEIEIVEDARHGTCEVSRWRGPDGSFMGEGRACPAGKPEDRPRDRLAVGWAYAPARTLWLRGTVPDGTATVEVAEAVAPVQLDRSKMMFAVQVPQEGELLVIARDADGRELDRWEGSPMLGARP